MIMSLVVKNLILVNSDKAEIIMNRRRSRSKRGSFIVRSKRFFDESDM